MSDLHETVPKVIAPLCPDCGYGHIDNGDGTSTTTMRQSAYLYGQCCETCGVKFGWEAEKAGVDVYASIREVGRKHAEKVNQAAFDAFIGNSIKQIASTLVLPKDIVIGTPE